MGKIKSGVRGEEEGISEEGTNTILFNFRSNKKSNQGWEED